MLLVPAYKAKAFGKGNSASRQGKANGRRNVCVWVCLVIVERSDVDDEEIVVVSHYLGNSASVALVTEGLVFQSYDSAELDRGAMTVTGADIRPFALRHTSASVRLGLDGRMRMGRVHICAAAAEEHSKDRENGFVSKRVVLSSAVVCQRKTEK